MDYLYSQLPEVVYNPEDLTGESPNGTIQLNIDNDERKITADVLKTPGVLRIKDLNVLSDNNEYIFDGSNDIYVEIAKF